MREICTGESSFIYNSAVMSNDRQKYSKLWNMKRMMMVEKESHPFISQ